MQCHTVPISLHCSISVQYNAHRRTRLHTQCPIKALIIWRLSQESSGILAQRWTSAHSDRITTAGASQAGGKHDERAMNAVWMTHARRFRWFRVNRLRANASALCANNVFPTVCIYTVGKTFFWSPDDFVYLTPDKEMISLEKSRKTHF